ncbi:AIG1-type G domain-containing protein [Forsythia ovata]|uniref:AIG1-type G domain-containing protein n=1 Tax=Forsythia ovata TaxID=205694 RepID=A0ABD1S9N2_9LAMI
MNEVVDHEDLISDDATDGMIFGSYEAAKQFIKELEWGSDSEEETDTDEEGDGKELFDSAALAALLKAATFLMFEKPTSHHPETHFPSPSPLLQTRFWANQLLLSLSNQSQVLILSKTTPSSSVPSMAFAAANV